MGLFSRAEQRLERAVNGVFARVFTSEVQPVEIASAIRRAMDERAAVLGKGRTIVPNLFTVELSGSDYEHLTADVDELTDELVASAEEHADTQRYTPGGPIHVHFNINAVLETGVFQLRPSIAKAAMRQSLPSSQQRPQQAPEEQQQGRMPQPAPSGAPDPQQQQQPWGPSGAAEPQQQQRSGPSPEQDPTDRQPVGTTAAPPWTRPQSAHRPYLDIDGQHYPLLGAITVLGRDDCADVVLDDPGISRQHSEIRVTSDGPHLLSSVHDLHSTNGTYVNGDPITSRRLADGDRITVGRTALVFHTGGRR